MATAIDNTAVSNEVYTISVLPQGVYFELKGRQNVESWLQKQMEFNNALEPIISSQLLLGSQTFNRSTRLPTIQTHINEINANLKKQEQSLVVEAIERYLEPARNMRRLVADGVQAKRLLELGGAGKTAQAHLPLLVFSDDFQSQNPHVESAIELYRMMWSGPIPNSAVNLFSASAANDASQKAEQIMRDELAEVRQLVETQKQEMVRLHDLYHEKLIIEAPAANWETVSSERTMQWRIWLAVFVLALVVPAWLLIQHLEAIIGLLVSLSPKEGPFSVAGLAVITAPALLYAWMLRQVSRIYTRSFDLAVDAKHRKALATTYLGLAENTKLGVTQTDRAIVLQALFRPQPPNTSDDGPPMGLIELLKSKE